MTISILNGRRLSVALFLVLTASSPSLAQRLGQGTDDDVSILRIVLVLILCLGLAVCAAFALRARMGRGAIIWPVKRTGRRLELQDSLRLPNQVDLAIVRCDGEELLIATSAQGLVILKDAWLGRPAPDAVEE